MIKPVIFLEILKKNGVDFFTGVPDSLLKDICLCIENNVKKEKHIIAANEGAAIGLAVGHYLATERISLVYMQNSGLGNSVNPLTSLADEDVYGIPMLLMIGWRGEPDFPDESQHKKMGKVTLNLLDAIGVPYVILSDDPKETEILVSKALSLAVERTGPVAIIVRKNVFSGYLPALKEENLFFNLSREKAVEIILGQCGENDVIVSTTGKLSRELFELREKNNQLHSQDFLTVGSMGHASQIALGISLEDKKRVICLDGDGAMIMHLGSLATCGVYAPTNFLHIVLNNGCHESVGGQPTLGFNIDLPKIAEACGYKYTGRVEGEDDLLKTLEKILSVKGPVFLEVRLNKSSRSDLGRPTKTPQENKLAFVNFLKNKI
ncbi:MAG: phosphonopyruvate decarboxylase [Candidatus Paceibacterota bacterium]|jgi:phosphonopyruvate decarboxylase